MKKCVKNNSVFIESIRKTLLSIMMCAAVILLTAQPCYANAGSLKISKHGLESVKVRSDLTYITENETVNQEVTGLDDEQVSQIVEYGKSSGFILDALPESVSYEYTIAYGQGGMVSSTEYKDMYPEEEMASEMKAAFESQFASLNCTVSWAKYTEYNGIDYIALRYTLVDSGMTINVMQYTVQTTKNALNFRLMAYYEISDSELEKSLQNLMDDVTYTDEFLDGLKGSTGTSNATGTTDSTNTTKTTTTNAYKTQTTRSRSGSILEKGIAGAIAGGIIGAIGYGIRKLKDKMNQ